MRIRMMGCVVAVLVVVDEMGNPPWLAISAGEVPASWYVRNRHTSA